MTAAAVLVLAALAAPALLTGFGLWLYTLFSRSLRAAYVSHGFGVAGFTCVAALGVLVGDWLAAAGAVFFAGLFGRWWWLTRRELRACAEASRPVELEFGEAHARRGGSS